MYVPKLTAKQRKQSMYIMAQIAAADGNKVCDWTVGDRPRLITDLRMPENHWIQMLIPKWNEETVCPKKNKTEMPNEESPCLLLPTLPKCKKWTADNTGITFIISRQTTSRKV